MDSPFTSDMGTNPKIRTRRAAVLAGMLIWVMPWMGRPADVEGEIEIWPEAGTYTNGVGVMLWARKGSIHYTLDGSEPGVFSSSYREPLWLVSNTVVRAAVWQKGDVMGPTRTFEYRVVPEGMEEWKSTLPTVLVHTLGIKLQHRERSPAWLTVVGVAPEGRPALSGPVEYHGHAEVGIRGNSSSLHPKKPYRVEIQDAQGEDLEVSLLGMPGESDWILYPAYTDRTFARDILAYELWRQLGYDSPRWRLVELFVIRDGRGFDPEQPGYDGLSQAGSRNGLPQVRPADYEGVYVLIEKIKRDKNRLDLAKLKTSHVREPEISGGYIIKKDRLNPGEVGFRSGRGVQFCFEEPKEREITGPQRQWLTNHIGQLEAALFGDDFRDPERGYGRYLEASSFVDYHWVVELSRNFDGYWFSVFLHKDRGGRWIMGPIWDWDASFGNTAAGGGDGVEGWRWNQMKDEFYGWFDRMFEDPDFLQAYIDRWPQLREGVFSQANLEGIIDRVVAQLEPVQARNFQRWPSLSPRLYANHGAGPTYQDHVRHLKEWLARRVAWIDGQGFPAPAVADARAVAGGMEISLRGQGGRVYFTLDGSDPRLPGGSISGQAQPSEAPIVLARTQVLRARVHSPYQLWSSPLMVRGDQPLPGGQVPR